MGRAALGWYCIVQLLSVRSTVMNTRTTSSSAGSLLSSRTKIAGGSPDRLSDSEVKFDVLKISSLQHDVCTVRSLAIIALASISLPLKSEV